MILEEKSNSYKISYENIICQIGQRNIKFINIIASDKLLTINQEKALDKGSDKMTKSILAYFRQFES